MLAPCRLYVFLCFVLAALFQTEASSIMPKVAFFSPSFKALWKQKFSSRQEDIQPQNVDIGLQRNSNSLATAPYLRLPWKITPQSSPTTALKMLSTQLLLYSAIRTLSPVITGRLMALNQNRSNICRVLSTCGSYWTWAASAASALSTIQAFFMPPSSSSSSSSGVDDEVCTVLFCSSDWFRMHLPSVGDILWIAMGYFIGDYLYCSAATRLLLCSKPNDCCNDEADNRCAPESLSTFSSTTHLNRVTENTRNEVSLLPTSDIYSSTETPAHFDTATAEAGVVDWAVNGVDLITKCGLAPFWEELLYRGYLLPQLHVLSHPLSKRSSVCSVTLSIIISSLIFAASHSAGSPTSPDSWKQALPMAVLGVTWSTMYILSKNLMVPIAIHALWNARIAIDELEDTYP